MKKYFITLAIAAAAAALTVNVNAANPRSALKNTIWLTPAQMNAEEPVNEEEAAPYYLLVEFGPGGLARAQYCTIKGEYSGIREFGPSFPLKYKVRDVHNDGSMNIKLKGEIYDAGSVLYKIKPRRKIRTATGMIRDNKLFCGFGEFKQIN